MVSITASGRITKNKPPAMRSVVSRGHFKHTHFMIRLGQQMVYLYIDSGPLPVQVHRNVILRSSEFFKRALTGNFRETSGAINEHGISATELICTTGVINLRDQRRELVETCVEWLYFGIINPNDTDCKDVFDRFEQLYDLFVVADNFQDQEFANAVMDVLLKETDSVERWPTALAAAAWSQLPESSMMRKYIKDLWVSRSCAEWFEQVSGDMIDAPKDFWVEVAKSHTLIRDKKEKTYKPTFANRCRYHVHADGSRCA